MASDGLGRSLKLTQHNISDHGTPLLYCLGRSLKLTQHNR